MSKEEVTKKAKEHYKSFGLGNFTIKGAPNAFAENYGKKELPKKRVLITGASGFLGQHVVEEARKHNLDILTPTSKELDLTDLTSVQKYFKENDFDTILHLAAFVGGIGLNKKRPAELTLKNMAMAVNMYTAIEENLHKIKNVYNVLSVCGYPANCSIPFKEEDLWLGREEITNAGYSFAKKALFVLGEKYRDQYGLNSVAFLPANLYGPKDHFDLENSHVVPALVRKVCEAKYYNKPSVSVWGSGRASRDFLLADDCARYLISAVVDELNTPLAINLGTGVETSIHELVNTLCDLVGYKGKIEYDCKNPDGQARRCLDVTRAKELLGFEAKTGLREGLIETIKWYQENLFEKDMNLIRTGKIDFLNGVMNSYEDPGIEGLNVKPGVRIKGEFVENRLPEYYVDYKTIDECRKQFCKLEFDTVNSSIDPFILTKESKELSTDQVKEAANFIKSSSDEKEFRWYYNVNSKEVYQSAEPKIETDNVLNFIGGETRYRTKYDGYFVGDPFSVPSDLGFFGDGYLSVCTPYKHEVDKFTNKKRICFGRTLSGPLVDTQEKPKPLKFDKTFSIEEALKRAGIEKSDLITKEAKENLKLKKLLGRKTREEQNCAIANGKDPWEHKEDLIMEEEPFIPFKSKEQLDKEFKQAKDLFNKEIKPLEDVAINSKRGMYAVPVSPKNVSEVEIMANLKLPQIQPATVSEQIPTTTESKVEPSNFTETIKSAANKYIPRIKKFIKDVKSAAKEITKE